MLKKIIFPLLLGIFVFSGLGFGGVNKIYAYTRTVTTTDTVVIYSNSYVGGSYGPSFFQPQPYYSINNGGCFCGGCNNNFRSFPQPIYQPYQPPIIYNPPYQQPPPYFNNNSGCGYGGGCFGGNSYPMSPMRYY